MCPIPLVNEIHAPYSFLPTILTVSDCRFPACINEYAVGQAFEPDGDGLLPMPAGCRPSAPALDQNATRTKPDIRIEMILIPRPGQGCKKPNCRGRRERPSTRRHT